MTSHPDTRLYASVIAVVSGLYSIAAATADGSGSMPTSASVMLVLGVVVLLHGAVLLTPAAGRLGHASGPLMVLWAAIMLGNQALAAMSSSMTTMSSMSSMSWDRGMVAVAILMLASGLIMSRGRR